MPRLILLTFFIWNTSTCAIQFISRNSFLLNLQVGWFYCKTHKRPHFVQVLCAFIILTFAHSETDLLELELFFGFSFKPPQRRMFAVCWVFTAVSWIHIDCALLIRSGHKLLSLENYPVCYCIANLFQFTFCSTLFILLLYLYSLQFIEEQYPDVTVFKLHLLNHFQCGMSITLKIIRMCYSFLN